MPSMFTHLVLADRALAGLPGPLAGALAPHRRWYSLGSLAPDFPYFQALLEYRGLPMNASAAALSNAMEDRLLRFIGGAPRDRNGAWVAALHGPDARRVIATWLEAVPAAADGRGRPAALAAFLMGMLTHVAADESLHPHVEADTGDQASFQGKALHRALETRLDFILLEGEGLMGGLAWPLDLAERWLGHPGEAEGFFPAWLSGGLAHASGIPDGTWRRWAEGFRRGLTLLDHTLSPVAVAQREMRADPAGRGFGLEPYARQWLPRAVDDVRGALERVRVPGALMEAVHA